MHLEHRDFPVLKIATGQIDVLVPITKPPPSLQQTLKLPRNLTTASGAPRLEAERRLPTKSGHRTRWRSRASLSAKQSVQRPRNAIAVSIRYTRTRRDAETI